MADSTVTYSLLIGISSSLVATAIFILVSEIIRKVVMPWFEDKIYRGVRIDGRWENDDGDAEFNLKQWGNKITGYYSHGTSEDRTFYAVSGNIKNMYFMALAEPVNDKIIDAGVSLLHVEYQGEHLVMKGGLLYKGQPGEVEVFNGMEFRQKVS